MLRLLSIALLLLSACGRPAPAGPLEITPTQYDATAATQMPLADGATITLVRPPQGGFVVFVGVEARNVGDPTVELEAQLADATGEVAGEDARTVALVPSADPSVLVPDLRSFVNVANVALCPSTGTMDRFGQPMTLTMQVSERSTGRVGSASIAVMPECDASDPSVLALCQCECAAGYTLGKCSSM